MLYHYHFFDVIVLLLLYLVADPGSISASYLIVESWEVLYIRDVTRNLKISKQTVWFLTTVRRLGWCFNEHLLKFKFKCVEGLTEAANVFRKRRIGLTLSSRRSLSYRNQSINLVFNSVDWFLYGRDLRHERVKVRNKNGKKRGPAPLKEQRLACLYFKDKLSSRCNIANNRVSKALKTVTECLSMHDIFF